MSFNRVAASAAALGIGLVTSALAQVDLPVGFTNVPLATLSNPVGFAFLPDGRALLIEQKQPPPNDTEGWLYVYAAGSLGAGPALVVPDVNTTGNERGLLGIAVDPAFPTRPYVYVYYTHVSGTNRVRRYTVTGDVTNPWSDALAFGSPYDVLVDLPDALEWHNGGTLRFAPDSTLFLSNGDDATSVCGDFQSPSVWHGVLLRMDVSGLPASGTGPPAKSILIPADNPYPGPDDNARLTYAVGFRNPFRFTIDPVSGHLYVGDVGESAWEELDEVLAGTNAGWPMREGAHAFPPFQFCGLSVGIDPIAEYAHAEAAPYSIIAGPRYRPVGASLDYPPSYDGDVFYTDFYAGWIRRVSYDDGFGVWTPASPESGQPSPDNWAEGLTAIADFQVGPDGALYYVRLRDEPGFGRINPPTAVATPAGTPPAGRVPLTLAANPLSRASDVAFRIRLAEAARLTFRLFDATGREVAVRRESSARPKGEHLVTWSIAGAALPAGSYFLRVDTGEAAYTRRLVLID